VNRDLVEGKIGSILKYIDENLSELHCKDDGSHSQAKTSLTQQSKENPDTPFDHLVYKFADVKEVNRCKEKLKD